MLDKNQENVNNSIKKPDGSIEFNFGTEEEKSENIPKVALVFEETSETDESEINNVPIADTQGEASDDIFDIAFASDNITDEELKAAVSDIEKTQRDPADEEFIIPESFDVNTETDDYVSTIWRPYMPKFTETTENRYYFANNAELDKLDKKEKNELTDQEKSLRDDNNTSVSVVKIDPGNPMGSRENYNDPTAEIESIVPDVVVVNINGKPDVKSDTINIFKFSDDKKEEEKPSVSEEELERREITGLTGHQWTENVSEEQEEQNSEVSEKAAEEQTVSDERVQHTISEAVKANDDLVLSDYDKKAAHFAKEKHIPEGYSKKSNAPANDTSEYNSFSMRDTFKDKFLDSIMASRIRLLVAILLGVCSFIFDVFEAPICAYLGIPNNIKAPAVIDGCLLISMILISMPEIIKAMKFLIHKKVVPEISLALAGFALLVYTAAILIIPRIGYPLFSCVYSILAINSIFATNYLHSTNFSAFKIVSEKGNKQIIDKPFTRTLELENAALDGAVDEYKSKTASLYTTPFVSGFFKNASKNSENSKNNIIIIAISFGAAIVLGLVMLFIEGVAEALEAFALVISLSIPAFSILSHKLPYKNVQKEAGAEKSAVVGENALYEYSAVDVVTFEDTEVFGPDDVTLKSATDRHSDYVGTMRKMASLFAALGGPLCRVFESALNKKYAPADNVVIEDDGVEGTVDGKSIRAGNAEYMNRHGIKVPPADDKKIGSTRVIYAASEGEFFATFTVHYSFSEEFALELSAMRENGIVPLVYTRDFNINNEFMQMLTGGSDAIRVMRKYTPKTEPEVYSKIDSAMVTFGGKSAAINLILSSKRYSHFKSVMAIAELSACLTGAALAVSIVLSGMMFSLPAVILAIWQLGWSVVLAIISKKLFNPRKKEHKNAEEQ